jgi:hypothetical protein
MSHAYASAALEECRRSADFITYLCLFILFFDYIDDLNLPSTKCKMYLCIRTQQELNTTFTLFVAVVKSDKKNCQ